jgi:hypothetical protein
MHMVPSALASTSSPNTLFPFWKGIVNVVNVLWNHLGDAVFIQTARSENVSYKKAEIQKKCASVV